MKPERLFHRPVRDGLDPGPIEPPLPPQIRGGRTTRHKDAPKDAVIAELGAFLDGRMRDRCAESLVTSLYRRSGGNPFFAVQMLRLLEQEKQLEQAEDGWQLTADASIELPAEVRETVARRLRRLESDEHEVLRLGAVLGREFSYPALEAMWDGDERSLFARCMKHCMDNNRKRHL